MEKSKMNVDKTIQEDSFYLETTHKIHFQDAINLKKLKEKTVHLVVTSPPYWKIKDYGNEEQIGYNDSLTEYFDKLNAVWKECIRVSVICPSWVWIRSFCSGPEVPRLGDVSSSPNSFRV